MTQTTRSDTDDQPRGSCGVLVVRFLMFLSSPPYNTTPRSPTSTGLVPLPFADPPARQSDVYQGAAEPIPVTLTYVCTYGMNSYLQVTMANLGGLVHVHQGSDHLAHDRAHLALGERSIVQLSACRAPSKGSGGGKADTPQKPQDNAIYVTQKRKKKV